MQKCGSAHFCASKVTQIGVKEEACEESVCCVCGGNDFFQHAQITERGTCARVGGAYQDFPWVKYESMRKPQTPSVTSTSPMFTTLECYCSLIMIMFSAQQTQRVSFSVVLI